MVRSKELLINSVLARIEGQEELKALKVVELFFPVEEVTIK
jgi:hypothetical protein